MKWCKMKQFFCPTKLAMVWANGTKKDTYRCTGCGQTHGGGA